MTSNINHNNQKKIALVNDYSGFGRCSVAVQLPIISMMHVQCCPVPTSIFSNHTGFPKFYYQDYTEHMENYINMWDELGLQFSGICSGFLGSAMQIEIVENFINKAKANSDKAPIVVIDPVMGDYGKMYATLTSEMAEGMRRLVSNADIVTPNLTEACILTGQEYHENWTRRDLEGLITKVANMGAKKVVITGIPQKSYVCNMCYDASDSEPVIRLLKTHRVGTTRSGTGDIFSAIIVADAVNNIPFEQSVRKASLFIKKCIIKAIEMDIPVTDGVPFEEVLYQLKWR